MAVGFRRVSLAGSGPEGLAAYIIARNYKRIGEFTALYMQIHCVY